MWTIGLDVHWRTTSVCILNEYGKKIKAKTVRGPWEKVISYLAGLSERFQVCFEASCGYGALYDRLRPRSARVVVAPNRYAATGLPRVRRGAGLNAAASHWGLIPRFPLAAWPITGGVADRCEADRNVQPAGSPRAAGNLGVCPPL